MDECIRCKEILAEGEGCAEEYYTKDGSLYMVELYCDECYMKYLEGV